MENLNYQNFWSEMTEKYPNAVKKLGDWIDNYKKEVNWNALFKANETTMQLHSSTYKFHDVPVEFQMGVMLRYMSEVEDDRFLTEIIKGFRKAVEDLLRDTN